MASKLLSLRRLSRVLKPSPASPSSHSSYSLIYGSRFLPLNALQLPGLLENLHLPPRSSSSRSLCSRSLNLNGESQGPTAIDYRYVVSIFSLVHTFQWDAPLRPPQEVYMLFLILKTKEKGETKKRGLVS